MRFTPILRQASRADTLAFIGVGRMGNHMVNNILLSSLSSPNHPQLQSAAGDFSPEWLHMKSGKPKRILICDPFKENVDNTLRRMREVLGSSGGVEVGVVENPYEAALSASTLVSMIPTHTHVQSVYTGAPSSSSSSTSSSVSPDSTVLAALKGGKLGKNEVENTLCIEQSTIRMDVSQQVGKEIEGAGGMWVDAPVSGGVNGAENASLTIMCGASSPASFERAKPVLGMMGKKVIMCGGLGMGLAAKLCNNMQLGISMLGLSEAMLMGKKLGLDSELLGNIINTSTGQCWASSINFPVPGVHLPTVAKPPPASRSYEGGFVTALAHKDLDLAVEAARHVDAPLYVGRLAEEIFRKVRGTEDWDARDFSIVYKWLEEKSGAE
ncbi:6-phosphogluconate dehydrogenase [Filobasidium floriforme]|uniref:6-phosphogluconate dehydrogenase n=1 Tax=Filobasidium floriforme TaxID=5210 RepID=UPI001E8D8E90|nr:6-phosphogluconate dehydrogenase [Filobasidium floriforme]KAH8085675.1 6-phosphogluconate dehydrogenase [Filobasidium floriforme]